VANAAGRDEQRKRSAAIRNRRKLLSDTTSAVFDSTENEYSELREKMVSALKSEDKTEFRALLQSLLKKKNSALLEKATTVPTVFTEIVNGVAEAFKEYRSTPAASGEKAK
jgi:hypothetical protein